MERRVEALPLGPGGLVEGAFGAEDGPGGGSAASVVAATEQTDAHQPVEQL